MSSNEAKKTIYWEKQDSGFCAVHCINNLLQGGIFDAITLGEIANNLDEKERQLMMEAGDNNPELLRMLEQEETANVNLSGNFSIQVIHEALKMYELACVPLRMSDYTKKEITEEEGFICNHKEHWIAIRKLNGHWFNLNSFNDKGPKFISPFYLSAYLAQLQSEKYSVFVVQGKFPPPVLGMFNSGSANYDINTVINNKDQRAPEESKKRKPADQGDDDLQKALELSKQSAANEELLDIEVWFPNLDRKESFLVPAGKSVSEIANLCYGVDPSMKAVQFSLVSEHNSLKFDSPEPVRKLLAPNAKFGALLIQYD